MQYTAGDLRDRVEVLDLTETENGWKWTVRAETWAKVELTGKTCLFSKIGIGARAAEITLRRRPLSLHQAIRWRGLHLFLSEITEPDRGWFKVQAAVVELTTCRSRVPEEGAAFPAVLTEKYLRHEQETPMNTVTAAYVLVTPKAIALTEGGLVEVRAGEAESEAYQVMLCHGLDPFKHEYEIARKADL